MKVIDRYVRETGQSEDDLTRRLCAREEMVEGLGRDFRRYRSRTGTVSDARIIQITKHSPAIPNLCLMLILARALDMNVKSAIAAFGPARALDLVKYFSLSYRHFSRLFKELHEELPLDRERAWLLLQSQTLTGNTPMEADRYYPLMDCFMNDLARKINQELADANHRGTLWELPQCERELEGGQFPPFVYVGLPGAVELHLGAKEFAKAASASQTLFQQGADLSEVQRVANLFSRKGLMAYDHDLTGRGGSPPQADAQKLLKEAVRLFRVAHTQAEGDRKIQIAVEFLRFLLEPHRPKEPGEQESARALFGVVNRYYGKIGREGSAKFLLGCLLWLEGEERRAMDTFSQAATCGKESCGLDWIRLLRVGAVLADKVSRRARNRFLKLAEVQGVFSCQAAPRTKLLMDVARYQHFKQGFQSSFKRFPTENFPTGQAH